MSWQVVGHHDAFSNKGFYGPHPAKLWIGPARPRGYRRPRVAATFKSTATPTEYNEARAVLYAEWLAARDGVDVAGLKGAAVFTRFRSAITGENIRRVEAVEFRDRADNYGNSGPVLATIQIPHWDFEHPEPVEHFDAPAAAAQPAQQQIAW